MLFHVLNLFIPRHIINTQYLFKIYEVETDKYLSKSCTMAIRCQKCKSMPSIVKPNQFNVSIIYIGRSQVLQYENEGILVSTELNDNHL